MAGDTAFFNSVSLTGAQTAILPGSLTLGTLVVGDAGGSNAQTLFNNYGNLTLDNGGSPSLIKTQGTSASSARVVLKGFTMVANGNVNFQLNTGSTSGAIRMTNGSFNAPGHTVTLLTPTGAIRPVLYIDEPATAALWLLSSQTKVQMSGNPNAIVGDITLSPHSTFQDADSNDIGHTTLFTNNGDWNMGGNTVPEIIGGLSGTGSMDGPGYLIINGGTDAASARTLVPPFINMA